MLGFRVVTIQRAFEEICKGQQPWVALGDFLNYWWYSTYSKDRRQELIADPLPEAPQGEYYQRWAAFCAASVECLCKKYHEPCPQWVHDQRFVLPQPWYDYPVEPVPQEFLQASPQEFKKRNIFTSPEDRKFVSKDEFMEQYRDRIEKWYREELPVRRARKLIRERLRQRRKALAAK